MITRQELKQRAKLQLGGRIFAARWLLALLVCFVADFILNVLNLPDAISGGFRLWQTAQNIFADMSSPAREFAAAASVHISLTGGLGLLVFLLASGPLSYGKQRMFLKQARDGENMTFVDLFKGFTDDLSGNVLLGVMTVLYTLLWSFLFIVPGIVKAYAYALVFYVKADHPEMNWSACIAESQRLMCGNKGRLFVLELSFIGWYIVGAFCLGVGTLWVTPYVEAAKAHFYQTLLTADVSEASFD